MISSLSKRSFANVYRKTKANGLRAKVCAVIGAQWGDEGKGKLVDHIAEEYDVTARYNGGANAGHTVVVKDKKYVFHLAPCALLYPKSVNILGNGVVVHLPTLFEELDQVDKAGMKWQGRMLLSNRAHLVTQMLINMDTTLEKTGSIGTTKRGMGPTYSMKTLRKGLRIGDLKNWETFVPKYMSLLQDVTNYFKIDAYDHAKELNELKVLRDKLFENNMVIDCVNYLNKAYNEKKRILIEGANATMLDVDHGTYPFVTSSSTNIGGACIGLGFPPNLIESRIGVAKAYITRVGGGPFPTEQKNEIGEYLQKTGFEFGATTGRKRRCGWLDLNVMRYSKKINDLSSIILTKLDILNSVTEIKVCVAYKIDGKIIKDEMPSTIEELEKVECVYETLPGWNCDISKCIKYKDLPINAKNYVEFIETNSGVKVSWIGTGAARDQIVQKQQIVGEE